MTEPTSAVGAAVSGVGAVVLASLGIEPAALFWALVGASLGMSFAAATTRLRATATFVAVTLCCSLFGSWLAVRYFGGEGISRNAFACGLAIFFHPLLNAVITNLPAIINGLMKKVGISGGQ